MKNINVFISTLFFFLFLLSVPAYAGYTSIDGPANVRESPNGKIVLSLDSGVEVFACPALYPEEMCWDYGDRKRTGWYLIRVDNVYVRAEDIVKGLDGRKKIRQNAKLIDSDGNQIGTYLSPVDTWSTAFVSDLGKK